MPRRSTLSLSGRAVDRLSVAGRDQIFWDRELAGFGVRVYPSGRKVYVVQSRAQGGPRRVTLGTHGELTTTQARLRAAQAIDRIKRGEEPLPAAAPVFTVADLAERYMAAHVRVNCNAHTQGIYRGSLAEAWGVAPPGGNPCRFVIRYKEEMRERFLSEDEYRRVGRALRALEAKGRLAARAAAALRLVMLTGCRKGEILTLRWDDIDRGAGEIRLRDAKTGARKVVLTPAALRVLSGVERSGRSAWVFASTRRGQRLSTLTPYWHFVRAHAGVEDVRIHDLRHSFASRALALGENLTMIGRLLGHADVGSTARYAHLARDAEKVAVARVGGSIEADILRIPPGRAA